MNSKKIIMKEMANKGIPNINHMAHQVNHEMSLIDTRCVLTSVCLCPGIV